jgi:hypothetical protein
MGSRQNVADVWTILYQCFPDVRRGGMSVRNINNPSNGMMFLADLGLASYWVNSVDPGRDLPCIPALLVLPRWFIPLKSNSTSYFASKTAGV